MKEWKLQLEYVEGSDWQPNFKIKQMRRSLSEKLSDQIASLILINMDNSIKVEDFAVVVSNIEIREIFFRKREIIVEQSTPSSEKIS